MVTLVFGYLEYNGCPAMSANITVAPPPDNTMTIFEFAAQVGNYPYILVDTTTTYCAEWLMLPYGTRICSEYR